jgi:hypothetical protein
MAKNGGVLGAGGGVGTGLLLLVGGLILKHSQANMVAVCNSGLGQLGQAFDSNAANSCRAAQDLSSLGTAGIWVGAAMLIIAAVSLIALLVAAGAIAGTSRARTAGTRASQAVPGRTGPPCRGCGQPLRAGTRFCSSCGTAAAELVVMAEAVPGRLSASGWTGGRWLLVCGVATVLAAAGTGGTVFAWHTLGHQSAAAGRAPAAVPGSSLGAPGESVPAAPAAASSQPAPGQPTREQAAQELAGLLTQSVSDRSSVVAAVGTVNGCGATLSQDPQVFSGAAASRQSLLSQLADLPGRADLPAPMLASLASAWRASIQADRDFARWARDEVLDGCVRGDHSDPGYLAAVGPDDRATVSKQAFVGSWDPIAALYGLTSYQWSQL